MAYMGFDALKAKLAKRPGVTNPGALAASIGRKKYGKKKFQKAASKGMKMKGMKPMHPEHMKPEPSPKEREQNAQKFVDRFLKRKRM